MTGTTMPNDGMRQRETGRQTKKEKRPKRCCLVFLGLFVNFFLSLLYFLLTNLFFVEQTRISDDNEMTTSSHHPPHTAVSPCSQGGLQAVDDEGTTIGQGQGTMTMTTMRETMGQQPWE